MNHVITKAQAALIHMNNAYNEAIQAKHALAEAASSVPVEDASLYNQLRQWEDGIEQSINAAYRGKRAAEDALEAVQGRWATRF